MFRFLLKANSLLQNHHHNLIGYLAEYTNILVLDDYAEKSTYSKYFLTEGIDYHKFELKIDLYTIHIIRIPVRLN